jgi:hypothetical protein
VPESVCAGACVGQPEPALLLTWCLADRLGHACSNPSRPLLHHTHHTDYPPAPASTITINTVGCPSDLLRNAPNTVVSHVNSQGSTPTHGRHPPQGKTSPPAALRLLPSAWTTSDRGMPPPSLPPLYTRSALAGPSGVTRCLDALHVCPATLSTTGSRCCTRRRLRSFCPSRVGDTRSHRPCNRSLCPPIEAAVHVFRDCTILTRHGVYHSRHI